MALATAGTMGTFSSKSVNTIISMPNVSVSAASYAVVIVAMDNLQTTNGRSSNIISVRDSASNVWRKADEETFAGGGAAGGATVGVFFSKISSALSAGSVTAVLSVAVTAHAMVGWKFSGTSGSTLGFTRSTTTGTSAVDPVSMTVTAGTSIEYLFIRAIGKENILTAITPTASHTAFGRANTTGGSALTNLGAYGEWRIRTGLTDTSNPTLGAHDNSDLLIMLRERNVPITSSFSTLAQSGIIKQIGFTTLAQSGGLKELGFSFLAQAANIVAASTSSFSFLSQTATILEMGFAALAQGATIKEMASASLAAAGTVKETGSATLAFSSALKEMAAASLASSGTIKEIGLTCLYAAASISDPSGTGGGGKRRHDRAMSLVAHYIPWLRGRDR